MPKLPTPGQDNGQWAQLLNGFLAVEHSADGSITKAGQPNGYAPLDVDGFIPSTYLPAPSGPSVVDAAIVDGKGDIVAGSGDDAVARLAKGQNGQTLAASSSATVGLKWVDVGIAGHEVANAGSIVPQRSKLRFEGTGAVVADSPLTSSTVIGVVDEFLNVTDPRIAAVPNNPNADQGPKLQLAIDMAAASPNATVFFPAGRYTNNSTPLVVPSTTNIRLLGSDAAIIYFNQVGAGKYGLRFGPGPFPHRIENLSFLGPYQSPTPRGQSPGTSNAILCNTPGVLKRVQTRWWGTGVDISHGDQQFRSCNFQSNGYAANFLESTNVGNYLFLRTPINDCSLSNIAVSNGAFLKNLRMVQLHLGNGDFAFYRYGGAANPHPQFMENVLLENVSFEGLALGNIYDSVGDGIVKDIFFDGAGSESSNWVGPVGSRRADIDVAVVDGLRWRGGYPSVTPTLPSIRAREIRNVDINEGQLVGLSDNNGMRLYVQKAGGTASQISNIRLGNSGLSASAKVAAGPITKNDLVELHDNHYVRVAGSGSRINRVVGLAIHDCNQGEICTFMTNGGSYYVAVKNRSGTGILGGSLLKLNPAVPGTVMAANGWGDGQVIGQAYININNGANGEFNLFGRRMDMHTGW